jgi:uncharacterized protein (DUF427 family)
MYRVFSLKNNLTYGPIIGGQVSPWKGVASYYHIAVDGNENNDAAWHYPEPKEAAKEIKDHVAFWKGVDITQ